MTFFKIMSLHLCLISRLMGLNACDLVDEICKFIMLFLTKIHQCDLKCTPPKDNSVSPKSSLFSKPNLLSLSNLPKGIKRFGHLRLLWVRKTKIYISN